MAARAVGGVLAALLVAAAAWRSGSLSASGAVAATAVGAAAVAAGWDWGVLLVSYFVISAALSRAGAATKERRTRAVVEKGGPRDARQVLANGGLFAVLACVTALMAGDPAIAACIAAAALGALAASTADTWATEVGTLVNGAPRSLRGFVQVPPGTSGGVSVSGTLALVAGAAAIALASHALGLSTEMLAVAAGGVAGALADSVLGATLQERRWCPACELATERRVHVCGTTTSRAAGLARLDNDAVNFAATAVGALTAGVLSFARSAQ